MRMIKLTQIDELSGTKSQVYLNPESFVAVRRETSYRWTVVTFSQNYILVTQTPKAIFKLIAPAQDMSAPDAGLYDTSHAKAFDELEASFDRDFDDHLTFAEYDKDVLDGVSFGQGKVIQISDVTASGRRLAYCAVVARSEQPDGHVCLSLQGKQAELSCVHVGDLVESVQPGRR